MANDLKWTKGTEVDLGERFNGNVQIISNNNGAVTTFV